MSPPAAARHERGDPAWTELPSITSRRSRGTSLAVNAPAMAEATVFLAGDVMTGRGIDQILPCPSQPAIHESYVRDARGYVDLAEEASGAIPRAVDPGYIWGDALDELARVGPDACIVNLETSVTRSEDWWQGKGINYRMHPANVACLAALRIDVCALANNHVLDFLWDLSDATADAVTGRVQRLKRPGDVAVASIHWGSNWGYAVPPAHVRFAHRLVDGGVDIVHGHSSHHPRALEVYRRKLVLYGCGNFIDDYEGIGGLEGVPGARGAPV